MYQFLKTLSKVGVVLVSCALFTTAKATNAADSSFSLDDLQKVEKSSYFEQITDNKNSEISSFDKCPYGKSMRVAVIRGGYFYDFDAIFRQMCKTLMSWGYINQNPYINDNFMLGDKKNVLNFAKASKGGCFEFLEDGIYDGLWQERLIEKNYKELKERIKNKKDVDLLMAFGTAAGQQFADSTLGIPVMVMSVTDAESSGIIGEGEFSDKKNVHVQKEKDRYKSELSLFYDIFKFKKLGVIFDKTEYGKKAQAYSVVQAVAQDLGFELEICEGDIVYQGTNGIYDDLDKCAVDLASRSDAIYLTVGHNNNFYLYDSIKPIIKKGLPMFSQSGLSDVEQGVLLALSDEQMSEAGQFEANVARQIYEGVPPESISQYYYAPLHLALNLTTAKAIGWKPNFEILVGVDNVTNSVRVGAKTVDKKF